MIRAGTMRHVLSIYQNIPTKDAAGALVDNWVFVKNIRGSINPVTGTESFINDAIVNEVSHKIGIRHHDIDAANKIIFNDREFDIVYVLNFQEKKSNLILLANERINDRDIDLYIRYNGEIVTHNGKEVKTMELFDILTYDTAKTVDVLNIPEVYTPIVSITSPIRGAGKFEYKMSLAYTFSSITTSMFLRFRTNGGSWNELSKEPSDKTDIETEDYFFPLDLVEGVNSLDIEMRKETTAGALDVIFADVIIQRVG